MSGKTSEAQKRAVAKYNAANIVQVALRLNRNTDQDIIEALENAPSKQGYIKDLIRADIAAKQS